MKILLNRNSNLLILLVACVVSILSCNKKEDFLNEKSSNSLIVPKTLEDFQALLDNDGQLNQGPVSGRTPGLSEIGSDDYYITDAIYQSFNSGQQNVYKWDANEFLLNANEQMSNWQNPYAVVLIANLCIDGVKKIARTETNAQSWNNILGSGLFWRSIKFHELLQNYALPYDAANSSSLMGIPLRVKSDINEEIKRNSMAESYNLIIADLKQASQLLPNFPQIKTRPSKSAAYGLLSRVYLSMNDFDNALLYADSCLRLSDQLINYNNYTVGNLPIMNNEVLFHQLLTATTMRIQGICVPELYNSYDNTDIRRTAFFNQSGGLPSYKTVYTNGFPFTGIATDEIILNKAECLARKGDASGAIALVNKLLVNRYITGSFTQILPGSSAEALNKVLIERRKELVYRGLRWMDIRRLNKLGANITPTRIIKGVEYKLSPNSLKYAWTIPPGIVSMNPDLTQNPK